MASNPLFALVVALLASLALAADRSVDIFAWPLSAATSQPLAAIAYNAGNATLKSYTAPKISAGEDIIRVGFTHPATGSWSGVATSARNFAEGKDKTIVLHVNPAGEVYHVGFRASDVATSGSGQAATIVDEGVSVEVVPITPGPTPLLNKPVVLNEQGQVDAKEPEKSLLQKYWWVGVVFILAQIFMAGGKD